MENMHRDALGHLTVAPAGAKVAPCGHALALDFNHDERCPYCVDYEEAYAYDRQAARHALELVTQYVDAPRSA